MFYLIAYIIIIYYIYAYYINVKFFKEDIAYKYNIEIENKFL